MRILRWSPTILALTACAAISPIAVLEPGVYTVTVQNVSSWGNRTEVMQKATDRATSFCALQGGKEARLVNAVGNGSPALAPLQATIVFRCVESGKPSKAPARTAGTATT